MTEKLQKILARAGLGSRRAMEEWIAAGRVRVNGKLAKLGDRAALGAEITVDGKPIHISESPVKTRVIMYHKPEGEICTRKDPEGRPTVFEHLPKLHKGRWISIGRLDFNTSGLLLFTNDGEVANRLMHPSFAIEREYLVRVFGEVTPEIIQKLKEGVRLDDGLSRFEEIIDVGGEGRNHWYRVIIKEGKNRLVRRLWESQGVKISRLSRIRYGAINLPKSLRIGKWEELDPEAIITLKK